MSLVWTEEIDMLKSKLADAESLIKRQQLTITELQALNGNWAQEKAREIASHKELNRKLANHNDELSCTNAQLIADITVIKKWYDDWKNKLSGEHL